MARLEHIRGNTDCLYIKGNCIPVYRLTDKDWILMDSGSRYDADELLSYLKEAGIQVRAVLSSHAHYDHMGNHSRLKEIYGCKCIMTAFDAGAVRDLVSLKSCFYSCTKMELEKYFGDMICRADQLIGEDDGYIEVCGVPFQVLRLPGHAASQIGFVTADNVAYLADSILGPEVAHREKIVYMLNWEEAFRTMERVKSFEGTPCILSHYGVYQDIEAVSKANVSAFESVLETMRGLAEPEFYLEEMVKKTVEHMRIAVTSLPKARLMERVVRSMLEYMVETRELSIEIKEGLIVYRKT